tara:strand:- start:934 stop:1293 length:360 start_codon:yes stop_codon:yes gene_type:complete
MTDNLPNDQFDQRHEKVIHQDTRSLDLTHYVMAERCMLVEYSIIKDEIDDGNSDTLTYILEGGFRGFHKFSVQDLIKEYKDKEESFYALYDDGSLPYDLYDEDPLIALELDENGEVEHA